MPKEKIVRSHIAPCGMNCALCYAYRREKNRCRGCRERYGGKEISEVKCVIVKCPEKRDRFDFCFRCEKFPCRRIRGLDKRYRSKYGMSMIDNLAYIKERGINRFVKLERNRRKCPSCGEIICVHRVKCLSCGKSVV